MDTPKIFESEYRFCLILWENEPIKSPELAKLCAEKLGWKTSTTYTVIKRLSGRGVYNDNGNKVDIVPGMTTFTPSGQGHSVKNTGDEMLVFIALIVVE